MKASRCFMHQEYGDNGEKTIKGNKCWPAKDAVLVMTLFLIITAIALVIIFDGQMKNVGKTATADKLDKSFIEHGKLEEFLDKFITEKMAEFHVP